MDKTFAFGVRIIKLYKYSQGRPTSSTLFKQLLRSGTSIGANVEDALAASSTADFIHKLNIAAKEARETSYWLRLLHDNDFLPSSLFNSIHQENGEIIKVLSSILLTTKANAKAPPAAPPPTHNS